MDNPPSRRGPPDGRCYFSPGHPSSGPRQSLAPALPPQSGLRSEAPTSFGVPAQPQAGRHNYPPSHLAHLQHQIPLDRYGDPPTQTGYGEPSHNPWNIPQEPFQVHRRDPYQTQSLQHPNAHDGYGESSSNHPGTSRVSFLTPYQSPYPTQNQECAQNGYRATFADHSNQPQGDFPAHAQNPRQISPYGHIPAPSSIINNNDQYYPQERVLTPHQTLPMSADNGRHPKSNPLHQSAIWQMMQAPPQNPASQNGSKMTTSPATQEWHRSHQMDFYGQINVSGGLQVAASTSPYEQQERAPQQTVPSLTCPYQLKPQIVPSGSDHGPHVAPVEGPSQIPDESSRSKKDKNCKKSKDASRGPHRNTKKKIPSQHHQSESQDILNQQHRDTAQNIQNKQHLSAAPKTQNQKARIEPLASPIDFQSQEAPIKSLAPPIDETPRSGDMAFHDPDQTALENFALRPGGNGNVFFKPHSPETLEETYYQAFPEVMSGYRLVKEKEDALKMQERKEQLKKMEEGSEYMEEFVDFAASQSTQG